MKEQGPFKVVIAEDIGCDPRIPKGARLVCSETLKPEDGDYVLVMRKDAPPFIRGYFKREDGSILLKSFNREADSYAATEQSLEKAGMLVILRMEHDFPAALRVPCIPQDSGAHTADAAPPPESDDRELLTFEEAEAMLKVRRTKMYAMLRSGELQACKLGKLWRVERGSIRRYLASKTYKN